jgi:uncharacterized protein with HEPN domain
VGHATFLTDIDHQDAILWRLFTLADAATQLSEEVKGRHPEIPWRRVAGFRNIAAHAYLSLVLDAAWKIVEVQLPLLKLVVQEELAHPGGP